MNRAVRWTMVVLMVVAALFPGDLWAVTITTHGEGGSVVRPSSPAGGSPSGSGAKRTLIGNLDLPSAEKGRLVDAVELARLTGLQAKVALSRLAAMEDRNLPAGEILAGMVYAGECLDVMERAGKRLEDSARMVRMTWEGRFGAEDRLAAVEEVLRAFPAMAGEYGFASPEEMMEHGYREIGREMQKAFGGAIDAMEAGGRAIKNFASYVGGAVKSGVGKVTGAVASVHHKIGNLVGQKNWANIMAGTKFTVAVVGAGVGLVVALPATVSTAGALTAVAIYTAANVGAAVSFASDLATINGHKGPEELESAMNRISQGTAVIGIATSGSGGDVLVNVIGLSGGEIVDSTELQNMSPEELAGYMSEGERVDFLNNFGSRPEPRSPGTTETGGEGGGGGCGDCH